MSTFYDAPNDYRNYLCHYGVKGMRWRNRRRTTLNDDGIPTRHRPDRLDSQRRSHQVRDLTGDEFHDGWNWRQNGERYDPHAHNGRRSHWLIDNRLQPTVRAGQKRRAQLDVEENHHELAGLKGKRLNKGQNATDIPGVDDKSVRSPILQRERHSGRYQDLYKFGRTISDERRRGYRRPRAHNH